MKILLVQPPIRDFYHTRHRMYPLGLLYLASSLKKAGFPVEILDAFGAESPKTLPIPESLRYMAAYYPKEDKSPFRLFGRFYHFGLELEDEQISKRIMAADLVGISSLFTPYEEEALAIAGLAKKLGKLVVLGGHHATASVESLLANSTVDYVVCGEGENRLEALCKAICGQGEIESIDGLGYRLKNQIRIISQHGLISHLDDLPFPDRSLLDPNHYQIRGSRYTMILSSRGCNHRCRFCSGHTVMGFGVRFRSVDNILEEMRLCRDQYKIKLFDFEDENFTSDKNRAMELLEAIEAEFGDDERFGLLFENGLFPHSLDREILAKLKGLGSCHLNLPLVSSSTKTLKKLKRPGSSQSFAGIVKEARQNFSITGYLILGLPDEDLKEMIESVSFLAGQPVRISPSIFYPTPGTAIYPECVENDWIDLKSFLPLRSSGFPLETNQFQRLDLVTLFRLIRVINFIKLLIDDSKLKGKIVLSTFLRTELEAYPEIKGLAGDQEIVYPRSLTQKELGLLILSKAFLDKSIFYQIRKLKQKEVIYQFIQQEYSKKVWSQFNNLMKQRSITGTKKADLILAWDLGRFFSALY